LNDIPIDDISLERHCSEGKPHVSEVFCVKGGGIPTAIEGSRGRGPATESAVFRVFAKESARKRFINKKRVTSAGSRRKSNPDLRSWKRSTEGEVSLAQPFFSGKERLKHMIKQIELADERTAASTEASAASAGFVKVGNRFVKTGGSVLTTAFVDAYTRYDAEKNMPEQLENSGFAELNGDALVKFLSQSSDVEVESFFYVQKLALQVAFEKIMGKGSARDRANSRDERVIGLLGMWTGAMPDSTAITAATAAAGNSYSSMNSRDRRNTISVVAGQGFGELGVWGTRPSGINGGFYVQLQMAGERISEMQAQAVAEAGALDPISTFHAQLNPYGMMINSAYNVEMGSRVYGYDRGRLVNAQFMGALHERLCR